MRESLKLYLERKTPLGIFARYRRKRRDVRRHGRARDNITGVLRIPPFSDHLIGSEYVSSSLNPARLDYFLIWGHGLRYRDRIIDMICDHEDFNIIKVIKHRPKHIRHFVTTFFHK